ncbi:ELMD3-like protein [Mya arenaria]|uniref:ELMD3-like protein n=1 Tax=Mya arenaria TaxID=6604 RepID=A0ABY7FIN8_MYAAR|nr:ELMD3-like protein [Mya arenaria]
MIAVLNNTVGEGGERRAAVDQVNIERQRAVPFPAALYHAFHKHTTTVTNKGLFFYVNCELKRGGGAIGLGLSTLLSPVVEPWEQSAIAIRKLAWWEEVVIVNHPRNSGSIIVSSVGVIIGPCRSMCLCHRGGGGVARPNSTFGGGSISRRRLLFMYSTWGIRNPPRACLDIGNVMFQITRHVSVKNFNMADSTDAPIDLVFGEDDEADHDQILLDIETPRGKPPDLTNLFQASIEAPSIIVSEPDSAPQEEQIFDDNSKADTCFNVFEGVNDVGDVNAISADDDSNGQNKNADNSEETHGKERFDDENVHSGSSIIEAADSNNSAANKDPLKTQNEKVMDKKDETNKNTNVTDGNDKNKVDSRSGKVKEPLRPMISSGVPSLSEKQKSTKKTGEESNEAYSTQSKEFSDLKQLDTEIKAVIETGKEIAHGDNTIATDVSLSGIMMTEKQEENSDDEFDFDLPPAAQQKQGPTHPVPVSQTSAPKPPAPIYPAPELQAQGGQSSKPATVPSGSVGIQPSVGVVNSSRVDSRETTLPFTSASSVITSPGAGKAAVGQKPVAIIKPTTQVQNVDVVSIPQTQPVNQPTVVTATFAPSHSGLEAAQDEWDKVTTIQAGFKGTSTEARGVEPTIGGIKCNVERRGLSAFVNLLFGPPKLHRDLLECNRRGDVMSVVNEFYAALYFQMYQVWKTQGKTISDSGYVIKELEIRAKKNPRDILRHLDEYLNRKTVVVPQVQSDAGGDNFTNVCDD